MYTTGYTFPREDSCIVVILALLKFFKYFDRMHTMPPENVNNKRRLSWYFIRALFVLAFVLLAGLVLLLLQWELTVGKYAELTTAHRVEFGLVLTEYERSQYADQRLVPLIKILSVLEYTQQCSIVYALATYPRGEINSHTVSYYYTLQHDDSKWLVADVIKAEGDVKQPNC